MKKFSFRGYWRVLSYFVFSTICLYSSPASSSTLRNYSFQQAQLAVSGTILFEKMPMTGVTIAVRGSTNAVFSGADGKFTIYASPTDTLVISYIGFKTIEEPVSGRSSITIVLEEDITSLNEVTVNAGYYSVKESQRTGSIAKVDTKEIAKQPVTNILATMQGRVAGVNIVQESGIAGGGFSINIRGLNSLRSGANAPLYIIDGVPYSSDPISDFQTSTSTPGNGNPLNSINPGDIESLEILKDADATAIYGSRGANGVVLITTKKGKPGKTTLTVDASHSSAQVTRMMDLMDTQQYLAMRSEAFANDGFTEIPDYAYDVNGTWNPNRYTDWQKELFGGTSEVMALQASLSGGSEQTRYLFSSNYRTESSVFPGDFLYKKGGARLSLDHTDKDKKFHINFSGSYTTQNNDLPWTDFVSISRQLAPNAPALYDDAGNLNWENSTWENPLANLESKNRAKTYDLITNLLLSYQVNDHLQFKSSFGYTALQNDESRSLPSTMYDPAYNITSRYSSIYLFGIERKSWIVEPQVNYKRDFGKSHFDLLFGVTFQDQQSNRLSTLASGFSSNSLLYDLASASTTKVFNNDEIIYRYQAFFGRVNYMLKDRYILNLTGRRDGSSRFGPGKQYATFGAAGAAWLFSKEAAVAENLKFLSFGKLRTSYGTTGNDQIGDYQFLNTYNASGYNYGSTSGLQPSRLYNANFGWETNNKFEVALELGFFNDRVFLTTAWYKNRSSSQLVGLPLPGTTGFSSIQANLDATVQNTGFEATLRTVNVKTENFSWITNFNITAATNELVSFPGLETSAYRNDYVIGQPTSIRKLFHSLGVDPQTGIYKFEDVNGDGAITYEDDRQTVKDFNPDYYGGIQNQFNYKGLQLDFLFQFVKQLNFNFANTQLYPGLSINQPAEYVNSWHQPGDNAPYQMYTAGSNSAAMQASEYFSVSDAAVSDASYIRLKNISLSYEFPKKLLPQIGCRLSLQAQNLLTITKFKGADPEFTQGGTLPPLRVISLGMQFTF